MSDEGLNSGDGLGEDEGSGGGSDEGGDHCRWTRSFHLYDRFHSEEGLPPRLSRPRGLHFVQALDVEPHV